MTTAGLSRACEQRAVLFPQDSPLFLQSGGSLAPVEVVYETYGNLNEQRSNAIFVLHALTGDAHATGLGRDTQRGWWETMVGPGRPVDTDRFFVICPNLLGGCRGTTGPSSIDPDTGKAYGLRFPLFTVRDLVTVHRALLGRLGIERLYCAIGGSLGGMQALQWALDYPLEIDRAVLVCTSARLSAENIAFSAVGRAAIMRDPSFQGGDYHQTDRRPDTGLSIARMAAHITYRSEESLESKLGRSRRTPIQEMTFSSDFEVEHYLDHQAESFLRRFDALSYIYLTRAMDYFEPFAEPDLDLPEVKSRFLLISFDTDWRFSTSHSRYIAESLHTSRATVDHREITSPWGHDSFLLEVGGYQESVSDFLADRL